MAQHTPGPWAAEGWLGLTVNANLPEGKATICLMPGGRAGATKEELQANARIIAAAPELLEALEDAANVLEFYCDVTFGKGAAYNETIKAARAAIKKAKGE